MILISMKREGYVAKNCDNACHISHDLPPVTELPVCLFASLCSVVAIMVL